MKKGQVFVRARIVKKNYWVDADVLDLDEESFRAFVVGSMFRSGLLVGIKDEAVEGDHIELHVKKELEDFYIKEKEGE